MVWSTSKNEAKYLMKLSEEEFIEKVNEAVHSTPPSNPVLNAASGVMKSVLSTLQPGKIVNC